ncbi:MAG TPA: PRC-barrel domain-containing protein [Flavitalea sp.]|nr:PRC-barrel domain-containing protein [Flavitalea sp.]
METNNSFSRLRELRSSGYEIVDGEPDIIGWSIKDTSDRKLGVVHDLLFDPEQQKVRYIIAHLKDNDFDLDRRKVLIPIGVAHLPETNDNVILESVNAWQIRALPTYDKNMGQQDEQDIFTIFSSTPGLTPTGKTPEQTNLYEHSNYNYDNVFKNRKNNLQDKPNERTFRLRQQQTDDDQNLSSREYDQDNRHVNEPVHMAVRQLEEQLDNDNMRHEETKKDRLIDRIIHLKNDLNEIERDLRNTRDI